MDGDGSLKLTDREISSCFADPVCAEQFPPVLTIEQAAQLLQVPVQTVYQWRSRGLLGSCCRKIGKHLRFYRDRLIKLTFNEGLTDEK
jgi:excisionase family DNA binding protein